MADNKEITTTKVIRKSGGCLALNLTKEMKMLGLEEGDTVLVTVQRVE